MNNRNGISRLRALIVSLVVTGCAQAPAPQDHYYRLAVSGTQPVSLLINGSLEVQRLTADSLTAARAIVYAPADASSQLMSYHYHFWVESPATMLQQELVRFLRDAGAAAAVTTPELRTDPDYKLHGRILRLEHVTGPRPSAAIELELVLIKVGSEAPMLVKTYQKEMPLQNDSVLAAVDALNKGLVEIYTSFLKDLSQAARD